MRRTLPCEKARRSRPAPRDRAEVFIDYVIDYAAIIRRAEAWRADVIVIGSHGRSGLVRAFGGVVERVLRHAHCSVLVARPSVARGWVLAATDLSDPSLPAITTAAAEAKRRGETALPIDCAHGSKPRSVGEAVAALRSSGRKLQAASRTLPS